MEAEKQFEAENWRSVWRKICYMENGFMKNRSGLAVCWKHHQMI